jgi:small-conductance mechanosensitive channel
MKKLIGIILVTLPQMAFAVTAPTDFKSFAEMLLVLLQNLISFLFIAMIVGLLYGVLLYMINSDNEKKREQLKGYLLYGVIALFVVVSLWGILAILAGTGVGIPQLSPPH